jgi:hypothetical protein
MAGQWAFVGVLAALGAGSLWHARDISTADDKSEKKAWLWVVAGVFLLAAAGGIAISTLPPRQSFD